MFAYATHSAKLRALRVLTLALALETDPEFRAMLATARASILAGESA